MNRSVPLRSTMMDLNDDCLWEVFAYLNEKQLCDVADTCKRFRSLTQETFRKSKFKVLQVNKYRKHRKYYGNDGPYLLRLIRNFGENIESVTIDKGWTISQLNKIFEYVGRYCVGQLKSMMLTRVSLTDENVFALRDAIRHLQELKLIVDDYGVRLADLPSWAPNLHDMQIRSLRQWGGPGLRQAFPELKNIRFRRVCIGDVGEFLRLNPQLEGIDCDNHEKSIFRFVATNVPNIERLEIQAVHAICPENVAYLNQLRSLKVLNLTSSEHRHDKPPAFEPTIDSLEKFTVCCFDLRGTSTELTRLKNLRELSLECSRNVTTAHIMDVLIECRQLSHLTLYLCEGLKLSMANFIDILQYGEALERFEFYDSYSEVKIEEKIIFDADSYLKMVQIVQSRPSQPIGMEFYIHSNACVNGISFELLELHQHELKLDIGRSAHKTY